MFLKLFKGTVIAENGMEFSYRCLAVDRFDAILVIARHHNSVMTEPAFKVSDVTVRGAGRQLKRGVIE